MEDKSIDTGVAQNSTPTQAEKCVTAKIEKSITVDGKERVETYLGKICAKAGITVEEFSLLGEMRLAAAAATAQKYYPAWPLTPNELAGCVNKEREKTQKKPITENEIKNLVGKLFGSINKPGIIWIRSIQVKQVMGKEIDHNGAEVVVPRYQLSTCGIREGFRAELGAEQDDKRAYQELSWEELHERLCIKQVPPLDEVKHSAAKMQPVEDPQFAAMNSEGRIRKYWYAYRKHHRQKVCFEHGISGRQFDLLLSLKGGCGHAGASDVSGFESAVNLAARLNIQMIKRAAPADWANIALVKPLKIGKLLEGLSKQKRADSYSVDIVGIERKVVEQADANGQPVLVPHYRFSDNYNWDYMELEDAEQELIERLIKMGVIVRTAEGQWVDKYTGKVLLDYVRK